MKNIFRISIDDCRMFAHHGVMPQERRVGNEFSVSLQVTYPLINPVINPVIDPVSHPAGDASLAEYPDELAGTISYAELYAIVKEEMEKPRNLLETVAAAIAARISAQYPQIESGSVSITKLTPPIAGFTGSATVTLEF